MKLTRKELLILSMVLNKRIQKLKEAVEYNLVSPNLLKDTQELYYKIQEEHKKKLERCKKKLAAQK